jgi:hypothetical protein
MKKASLAAVAVMLIAALAACTKEKAPVSIQPNEASLLSKLGFDESVALELLKAGSGPLSQLTGTNEEFEPYDAQGLTVQVKEKKALEALARLRETLGPAGYMVFIVERNFGYEPDRLAVIKSTDQFDILRIKATNGINYDIENDEVIARLKRWNASYPFDIIAADFDFVEAVFLKPPVNMDTFAREVYKFCPDVVDQGVGTVQALAAEMRKTGTLYLWWD